MQAVNDYEAILNGPKYTVIFAATKGSQTVTGLKITMTDAYGNETKADGTTIQVPAGTYHFLYPMEPGTGQKEMWRLSLRKI